MRLVRLCSRYEVSPRKNHLQEYKNRSGIKGSNDEARNLKQFHFVIIVNIIRFLIQRIFTVKSCSTVGSKRNEVSNRALNFYKHIIKNCVKNREIIVSITE